MGCFSSKQQYEEGAAYGSSGPNGYAGGPAYVSHDDVLSQELLYNISNLGVDTKRYNGAREPSINRVGRQSVEGQGWGSHAVLGAQPGMQREMSVKEVPGTQLQWTASRTHLEDELQAANSHPAPSGDTDMHRLEQRLSNLHLDMWPMVGDGNCQFRAISNGLYGSEAHHALVRANVVSYMRQHKADFKPYLGGTWQQYITDMSHDGTWGDELTLRACCDAYGILLSVISSDEAHWFMRYKPKAKLRKYKGSPRDIFLTYIAPVHYNAIRRYSSQPQQNAGPSAGKTRLESLQEVSGHSDNSSPFAAVQQPFQ